LKSAQLLSEGMTLTDAALRAGFYDSAHFANTFRDTFGLSPSSVFSQQRPLKWFIAS
jgi:AraC-like DNA-binding protein